MKFVLLDFMFLLILFFLKLISLVDNFYIFSVQGSKLNKYIKENNQLKLAYNLDNDQKQNSFFNFIFKLIKSPDYLFYFFNILIISSTLLAIKIVVTYKYITSNFIYINLFHKNINISNILGDKNIIFIIIYYFLSFLLFFVLLFKFFKYEEKEYPKLNNENKIFLAKDLKGEEKYLTYKGLYQNILITGSIGTGKTSSAISNILSELIKNNTFGLIIDVKGNYYETVRKIAKRYGKEKYIIEISMRNNFHYNPLDKPELSSDELANYMIKVLKVLSKNSNVSDPFWLDKSESYIRDFITIIRAYNNSNVNFMELHKLVTDISYLEEKLEILKEIILKNTFKDKDLFSINMAISNIKNEYMRLDERVSGIIKSEITRITNVFTNNYDVYEKFCCNTDKLDFLDSKIVVLSFNIGQNRFLSKIISTYLKLDFQQQILSRKEFEKPVFFVCDEFQEIVNSEDSNFFSISREYKCINVISVQSYSSIINALQDERSANVIIQNLVNKIWFRNDDMYTVKEIIKQIGKEDKKLKTLSYTENGQNTKYSFIQGKFKDYKTGLSKGYSINMKRDYKIDEEDITINLNTFETICFLSDGKKIEIVEKMKFKRWE